MLNNVKIYANDKEIGSESSSETFGPYDPDEEVTVMHKVLMKVKRSNQILLM